MDLGLNGQFANDALVYPESIKTWIDEVDVNPSIIREVRKNLGMTQGTMARLLGVSISSVSKWEKKSDRSVPNERIASFLILFAEFSKKYSIGKGEIQEMMTHHGEPYALYRTMGTVFGMLEQDYQEKIKNEERTSL